MIDTIITFTLGIWLGTFIGICIAALMGANHYDDMSY